MKPGDAAATADKIRASTTLFRILPQVARRIADHRGHRLHRIPVHAGHRPSVGTRATPVSTAIGGTAELCFLAWLLIKAVNIPVPARA
jgi:hypothetical protein